MTELRNLNREVTSQNAELADTNGELRRISNEQLQELQQEHRRENHKVSFAPADITTTYNKKGPNKQSKGAQ